MPMTTEKTILETIKSPEMVKALDRRQLDLLAGELRAFLIKHVSENGGHLASNLGTVELTLALLRSMDIGNDTVIWDVGHQSYTYKILTGRADEFESIRKRSGLSGFPKRQENAFDYFNTGHSSTSISAALGFARASRLQGRSSVSYAIIGDGALTGGMAFEALNDAGASGDNITIILNDNEMSISKNVGGIAEYFSRLRSIRIYSGANKKVKSKVEKIPFIGKFISRTVHKFKSAVKYLFSQGMLFEEMGLKYLGPVDGHDIKKIENLINNAKKINGPVVVHIITKKGRGLDEAEKEPEKYHGIKGNGVLDACSVRAKTFSESFGCQIIKSAEENKNIVVITPAVASGCGLVEFSKKYPEKFFDVGIAEQHGVTLAAGMACGGIIPVVSSYSTFMQRAYDQILHDVCLMKLHVIFTLDRAGIVGFDGETHQGIYDLAYLSHMPDIKIYAPADNQILEEHLQKALFNESGPVVIRYPKGSGTPEFIKPSIIRNGFRILEKGKDILILAYGRMLGLTYDILQSNNQLQDCSLIDIGVLVPLDIAGLENIAANYKKILFIEDVIFDGSCAQRFISHCSSSFDKNVEYMVVPEKFDSSGSVDEILDGIGMGKDGIIKKILNL